MNNPSVYTLCIFLTVKDIVKRFSGIDRKGHGKMQIYFKTVGTAAPSGCGCGQNSTMGSCLWGLVNVPIHRVK